jgi:methylated-DNA-[protein]-cysteine S-methyltransferase
VSQRRPSDATAAQIVDTPLPPVELRAARGALSGLYLPDRALLAEATRQLLAYFAGQRRRFDVPLAAAGTPFQQRVWRALGDIPFAGTWSYAALARAVNQPTAHRAVGAANGRNPISIIIPCHRVIGSDGSLTGYGGGEPAKRWLLAHELRTANAAPGGAPRR